jgi:hypothetical protein
MKTIFQNVLRAAAFSSLVLAGAAQATPLTYDWSSTLSADFSAGGLHAGDKITGTLTYDLGNLSTKYSTTAGTTGYQYYNTPFTSTTLNIGATHATVNLYAMVVNDFQMWGGDELFFRADSSPFGSFELQFLDTSMAALTSLAMPTAVDTAKFGAVNLSLNDYSTRTYFRNPVSTFAPASANVPEPGSIALFGAALATLALARRRKAMR